MHMKAIKKHMSCWRPSFNYPVNRPLLRCILNKVEDRQGANVSCGRCPRGSLSGGKCRGQVSGMANVLGLPTLDNYVLGGPAQIA